MLTRDDFQYAMEMTKVLHEPDRRIETFGTTRFDFEIISEDMDSVGQVRIRRGEVEAQKPTLIKPGNLSEVELEGFDPKVLGVIEQMKQEGLDLNFLQYGFQFRRRNLTEELVHDRIEAVKDKALAEVRRTGNPSLAIVESIDDVWEVGIMKLTLDLIMQSRDINRFDLKRKGLI